METRDTDALYRFFQSHEKIVVLTGAGTSASSGIPTYRDEHGTWLRSTPIIHQDFLQDSSTRQRYWARSILGWPAVRDAQPNTAHIALASLEQTGRVQLLITQNVDRLHQRAGSTNVVDLHGRLDRVVCLNCSHHFDRERIQTQLTIDNAHLVQASAGLQPDGDADAPADLIHQLQVPVCPGCTGMLMPDVVFFGDTVPPQRVLSCMSAVESADAILVVGSSLQVFSGFRFCRRAAELGKSVGLINPGKTRADELAGLKLRADCGPLLQQLADRYLDTLSFVQPGH